jgi:hypothetical protein
MPHVWPLACIYEVLFIIREHLLHFGGIIRGISDLSTLVSWIFYVLLSYIWGL